MKATQQLTNEVQKKNQKQHITKFSLTVLLILLFCAMVYAAILHFFTSTGEQSSDLSKGTLFAFQDINFFGAGTGLELKPGDSFSVNTELTSQSSIPMYIYYMIRMPDYGIDGLYGFTVSEDWTMVEQRSTDTTYTCVYAYNKELSPGEMSPALTSEFTMKEMSLDLFSEIDDINLTISAYGCDTNVVDLSDGWNEICTYYTLSF